jgi:carbamoyl-phosphate synthase small subunit
MTERAILVLEDGSIFEGFSFGSQMDAWGEVVFNTSMTGYQEILTDPSYAGQIVLPTYPLIGNYGINEQDIESNKIQVSGFIIREECLAPSHYLNKRTIHHYLSESIIPGIWGIDTRALTRKLRSTGVMMGIITSTKTPQQALNKIRNVPDYGTVDFVKKVTTVKAYDWEISSGDALYKIVVLDCGLKYNILRLLSNLNCHVTTLPCTTTAEEILKMEPNGILLSPGPGNPELLDYAVETIKVLVGKKPMMGICLGSQLIGKAFGARNFKLKFGHRGGNHPVKDLSNGHVYITAQNHGYALDPDTVNNGLEVSHINLNDGTVEGVRHRELPIFAIQYHSEASPGPLDNMYLFDRFLERVKGEK